MLNIYLSGSGLDGINTLSADTWELQDVCLCVSYREAALRLREG